MVRKVNRGVLYEVSDQFYLFICTVELVVRKVHNYNLIVTYAGEDLRENIEATGVRICSKFFISHYKLIT